MFVRTPTIRAQSAWPCTMVGPNQELTSPTRSSFSVRHGLQPARMCACICARRRAERISAVRRDVP